MQHPAGSHFLLAPFPLRSQTVRPSSSSPSHEWGAGAWPHIHTWIPDQAEPCSQPSLPRHHEASVSSSQGVLLKRIPTFPHGPQSLWFRVCLPGPITISVWALLSQIYWKPPPMQSFPRMLCALHSLLRWPQWPPIKILVFMLCQGAQSGGVQGDYQFWVLICRLSVWASGLGHRGARCRKVLRAWEQDTD